jgi:arylsulfate sulfotransferase
MKRNITSRYHAEPHYQRRGWMMQVQHSVRYAITFLTILSATSFASAMSVTLTGSIPSPAPVATLITFTATVTGAAPGTLWYRFRSHGYDQDSHLIKDYGPENTLVWTNSDHEGPYEIDVDIRNLTTGDLGSASAYFTLQSLVTGTAPVLTPTSHPMVYLYSAPACKAGERMRVKMTGPNGAAHYTPYKACKAGASMNFYLAGMRGSASYTVNQEVDTGSTIESGATISLNTSASRTDLTAESVSTAAADAVPDGLLLQATLLTNSLATDLAGNLAWYYPNTDITYLTRPAPGGYFFGILEAPGDDQSHQVVREVDLVGMTVLATNAARINEQLHALGKRAIGGFHHEARQLPDGSIVVLGGVEQILTNVQGPGAVDVLGDMIIVLNPQLQVIWAWDTFDNLDVTREATLDDQCVAGGCPPLFLSATANDWTHGNCVSQTPDGNLLYSTRSQDWVIKIDYENGQGSGAILWRLGPGGDFQINSTASLPWFTHQHDPQFLADNTTLTVFDNGNVRYQTDPTQNSRGQVLTVNEQTKTANLILNTDLGAYSVALGAAQKLPNGDYHFDLGYLANGTYAVEVSSAGNTIYSLHAQAPEYRSFRMPDLYNPPYDTH